MKQLVILSGKGGTGKTTVATAFIRLGEIKAYADCDIDAPNLHLVTNQHTEPKRSNYYGLDKAEIDPARCIRCGLCKHHCRFDAIKMDGYFVVDPFGCEGCGVCEMICPANAIQLKPNIAGETLLYKEKEIFSTGKLHMGNGNSGLLVTEVKSKLQSVKQNPELAIIDGSPGIGCPVIASLNGAEMVLIVAEPTVSGIADMERIIQTARQFQAKIAVCVNKFDTNAKRTEQIQTYCQKQSLSFVGNIPFDENAVKAVNRGQSIVDIDCAAGQAVREVFRKTMGLFFNDNEHPFS